MSFLQRNKSVIAYFSFSLATSAIGFIAVLMMMRLMPPEEYGRIALFLSLQFIAVPIISLAADNLIAINKSKLKPDEYEHFKRGYVTFAYAMFFLVLLIFIILFQLNVLHDRLFILIPAFGLSRFLIGMASMEYVMEARSIQYGMVTFLTSLLSFLLTAIFLKFISDSADWRIISLLISDVIFVLVRYRTRMKLLLCFSVDKLVIKNIARFGFPLLLSVVPAWALNESDKLIAAHFSDMKSVGTYAAACAIGGIMITFNTAMLNAMIPKIYKALSEYPDRLMDTVQVYAKKSVTGAAFFGMIFALIYGVSANLILPEKYSAARNIVYVIILFSIGRSLYTVLGTINDYYGMTHVRLLAFCAGGAVSMITATFGINVFGIIGVAVGAGSGYLVLCLILWLNLRKNSHMYQNSTEYL